MKKGIKIFFSLLMLSGLLVGCGNNKLDIKVGNKLSNEYEVVDSDKLDINKSMYYSISSTKPQKDKLTIEIQNAKDSKDVLKEDVKIDENKKSDNIPASFKVLESGEYKVIVKNEKNKTVSEKKFSVEGTRTENLKKKEVIKKSESKEVKDYNEAVEKVKTAKKTKLYECVDVAKKAVSKMNNSEKKTSLIKELDEIKQPIKVNKTIKGQYKSILGVDVVETDFNFSNDCKVFVDYKEEKVYKTSKNKLRFSGKKNSTIFISKGKEVFKVVF